VRQTGDPSPKQTELVREKAKIAGLQAKQEPVRLAIVGRRGNGRNSQDSTMPDEYRFQSVTDGTALAF
jgi:hypothetical protein